MASAEISPTDVVAALDELTIDKTKELFFHLKVKLKTLNDIDTAHTGNMRKIHYVQAWFDQEVGASWEKIVAGLKQIGMKALAESLATRKCLGSLTPDPRSSPVTTAPAPETSGPQTSGSTEPSLGPVARLSSPSDRISQVWAEIDRLTDTFSHLVSDTRDEMCIRASVEPQFFNKFRDRLLDLPVSQKSPHAKFFDEKLDDFLMAKNMDKIFAILRRYSNYRNYAVLREVVRRFCEAVLQRRMQEYCKSLEKFEKATFIDVYLQAISAGIVLTSEFTKMTVKINKPASACTVHEVRKLKETIAERASLQPYSMYIEEESIDLKLGFPASCVGWILGVLTPEFLATHRLSDVVVRQQNQSTSLHQNHLSILERTQAELTKELCTASRRGDMMRVVSLLNSGAHMETEDEWSLTPLGSASFYGHLQVVRLLTSRRANPNYVNKAGLTALMNAVNGGKSDVVTELISLKADVDFQSKKNGNSALIEAVLRSLTDVVVELIRAGANINLQNNNGDTAAILAVERYYPDIVRELVRAGSDLNLQNQEGLTPLMIAARRGRTDITTILLEGEHINLDIQENSTGWSALHFSVERGDSATTEALLKAGANPHLKDKNGLTALEIAQVEVTKTVAPHWSFYPADEEQPCYDAVISLLRVHIGGNSHSTTLPSHHMSVPETGGQESYQDTPPTQQDSSTVGQDTPPTQHDIIDTTQITSRQKRHFSQARRRVKQIFNDLDRRLKSADKKDQSESRIPSGYKFDNKHPGIQFFGGPWKQSVTSAGAHITWREEIGVEFDIPPGAVPEGRELDLSVWPCFNGPFLLPDGYELASPVFLIPPTFEFSREITVTLWHFSNLETVEDSERMVFLSAPSTPHTKQAGKKPVYQFRVLGKGVFEPRRNYGQISLTHFCFGGIGRKHKKHSSPSDSPVSKKPRDNRYVYQVYQDKQFGDRAIFSAFLDHKLHSTELEEHVKKYWPQLWSPSSVPISIEGDRVKLQWPSNTGWVITPHREPCELTKDMVDSHQRHPYPPMIMLQVEKAPTSSTLSPSIRVDIVGIREQGERFILTPKLRQTGLNLQSSLSSPSHTLQSSQMVSYSSSREQADTAGASVEQARQRSSHPNLRDLLNNITTTKWYVFGLQLTSNIEELNTIKTDNKGDAKTALQETLNLVLREDPDLSWQKVVEALQTIGEVAMARTINKEFC